ncbi:MAG TPA: Fmu (Sun) domain protein [Chitinophagaceae bacterium]|jgi:16S rRNA C967 or C1407 C5-methylase (RsmB/RsmF family)/NOL1/NOP2/fmu family ribosome biogenesis protein|nr:Fmu (Sun) domain protein [Chitinophagaceae bacterium]
MSLQLPVLLLDALEGVKGFDRVAFEKIHASGEQITSVRLNPLKVSIVNCQLPIAGSIPWAKHAFYLMERPSFTFDPLFHAGCYYVQEASSMFLEQAITQTVDLSKPLKVLDLCASPGGKSTHIQSLLSKDSWLVSNEVIRSRANVLKDNMIKWGCENVIVTNNDPANFSQLENYFDLIVVDAPCSGSGLFRRDPEAIGEWSENNVQLCSQRQQRILADCWPALKKGGVLIYSTCSYSEEEDEQIVKWMKDSFDATDLPLTIDEEWGIMKSSGGYRFWPDKVKGEGFFIACFQKNDGDEDMETWYKKKPGSLTKKEKEVVEKWVDPSGKTFIKYADTVYAWPENLLHDGSFLLEKLRVIYSGVVAGELVRDKLIPGHALAMSTIMAAGINRTELNTEQAIRYLQRKDMFIEANQKGWQLVMYEQQPLGWINALPNRINNYYPKELRILKDS